MYAGRGWGRKHARTTLMFAAVIAVSGCGSGSRTHSTSKLGSTIRVSTIVRAMEAAKTARVSSFALITNDRNKQTTIKSVGVIDFDRQLGAETSRTIDEKGRVSTSESVSSGADTYLRGSEAPLLGESETDKKWTRTTIPWGLRNIGGPVTGWLNYVTAQPGMRIERVGTEDIRGEPTTHYRITSTASVAPKLLARGYTPPIGDQHLWIDSDARIRRVVSDDNLSGAYHIRSTSDLYDFGVTVDVTPPPDNEVLVDHSSDPPTASGPWELVAKGLAGSEPWHVMTIATEDGVCFSTDTWTDQPEFGYQVAGRNATRCTQFENRAHMYDDPLSFTLQLLPDGSQLYFGSVDPNATSLTLHYDDGQTEDITPVHAAAAFSITGNHIVTKIVPHIPDSDWTCALDTKTVIYNCSGSSDIDGSAGLVAPDEIPIPTIDRASPGA